MSTGSPTNPRGRRSNERPHNPWREAVQERVVRQIRMLRAMRRELETGFGNSYTGTQVETLDPAKERHFPTLTLRLSGAACGRPGGPRIAS
jgi:hypothetical protein